MTSAKSFNNTNDPRFKSAGSTFLYTFRTALSGNVALPIINFIALCGLMPGLVYMMTRSIRQSLAMGENGATQTIRDQYKFMLMPQIEPILLMVIPLLIIMISVLMGVMMFRFIASKKTVNVFYSLGISRKNLFLAKYAAGLLLLLVSTALPVLLDIILNISIFGSSALLWKSGLFYLLGFCLTAFVAFSVTAAVFSGVGTVGEGLIFSCVTLGLPTIVFACLQNLMDRLVWGNPFGHPIESYSSASLLTTLSAYNPLLFMKDALSKYGVVDAKGEIVPSMYGQDGTKWVDPNFWTILPWILVGLAALGIALIVFQKRRAEICGFIGANKVLNTFVTFALSFTVFCIILRYTSTLALALSVLIGAVAYFVLYCIIDAILIRNWKQFLHGMIKFPLHAAAVAILFLVFSTGLFGFTTRIPDVSKIDSIVMSGVAGDQVAGANQTMSFGSTSISGVAIPNMVNQYLIDGSDSDKELVQTLHQKLIDARKAPKDKQLDTNIAVLYRLKNGKTLQRFYNASTIEALTELLRLEETQSVRDDLRENLLSEPKPLPEDEDSREAWFNMTEQERFRTRFGFDTGSLYFMSPDLTSSSPSPLNREDFMALKKALLADLEKQTITQKYFSEQDAIGILQFAATSSKSISQFVMLEVASEQLIGNSISSYVIITKDMENTVRFLTEHNLLSLFESDASFTSAEVFPVSSIYDRIHGWRYITVGYEFGATRSPKREEGQFGGPLDEEAPANSMKVTDAAQIDTLLRTSRLHAYTKNEGYFVRFTLSDESTLTKYLPASSAPQFVKNQIG